MFSVRISTIWTEELRASVRLSKQFGRWLIDDDQLELHLVPLPLNFMVRNIFKYLMVIGVVLIGFQCSALTNEKDKDKDKKKEETTVVIQDTIKIIIQKDISVGDTLVFDDYDEDDLDDDDNSSIAKLGSKKVVVSNETLETTPVQEPTTYVIENSDNQKENEVVTSDIRVENTVFNQPVNVNVFPNPCNQHNESVTVTHQLQELVTITVISLSGQTIQTITTDQQRVELNNLSAGYYLIQVTGSEQSESKRLLVQ